MKTLSQGWYKYDVLEFSRPPTPLPIYLQNSSTSLNLNLQFQTTPLQPPASLQMITNQRKYNPSMTTASYQVLLSGRLLFSANLINLVWLSFDFFLFSWSLTFCFVVPLYSLVCAVVQKYHEIQIFSTPFAISLLQSTNYGTTIAPCMWTNKIKAKRKPCYITFTLTTCSIVVRFTPQVMQWYH